jgi:2,4-dienoyl-CoA reductase (NADPH2)
VKLLEPVALGSRVASNRVLFGPHVTNLCDGRALSERHVAYYRRRAEGGAGVVVVEESAVHPSDWPYERSPLASSCTSGWAAIAEACRPFGTIVLAAIGHTGGQGSSAYSQRELWAPSGVPEVNTREVPKVMEAADIAAVVAGFVAAARAAVAAGCDGVEVNAGQYSLLRQFLSGLTNQRNDEWGTDRSKLLRDVLDGVRGAIGDAVLALRLSCDELAPWAGLVPEAAADLAAELVGPVDLLTVVRGSIFSTAATAPDGHVPPGFNLDLAAMVRARVREAHGDRVPVFVQGSMVDVGQAEWAVGDGERCDGVEMTRALLADTSLVSKLGRGEPERIRPCILCNQTCQVRDARNPIVTCVVDPRTGHELTEPDEAAPGSSSRRSVTIVGAGPAGLEAARVASMRGHRVRVVERDPRTGGATRLAAAGAGRERLALIVDWLEAECRRAGVEVELGREIGPADVGDGAVVIATGGARGEPGYRMSSTALVRSAADVLVGEPLPDGPVLVWDPIGGPIGVSVAERLAAEGRTVTIATPDNIVGNELSRSGDLAPANARLAQAGVTMARRTLLRSVERGSAEVEDRFSGAIRTIDAAVVIDAGHRRPDEALFGALQSMGREVVRAGDCVAPRTIAEAILEGRRAALALDGLGRTSDGVPMGIGTSH